LFYGDEAILLLKAGLLRRQSKGKPPRNDTCMPRGLPAALTLLQFETAWFNIIGDFMMR
jgi:hypothetical protein